MHGGHRVLLMNEDMKMRVLSARQNYRLTPHFRFSDAAPLTRITTLVVVALHNSLVLRVLVTSRSIPS